MKNPKDKAIELVNKYKAFDCDCDMPYCDIKCSALSTRQIKEMALIVVDEILDASLLYFDDNSNYVNYWAQVKAEMYKL